MKKGLNRRKFIKNSALGIIGGTLVKKDLISETTEPIVYCTAIEVLPV